MEETSLQAKDHAGDDNPKFVALGGIWLDEICAPGKETLFDVPGGSVPFATFGAQIFTSPAFHEHVGLIVKAGHDFPLALERTFQEWDLDLHVIRDNARPCSRGRIIYGQTASERTYQRLTEPFPSTTQDVLATGMISSASFHFFDVPATVSNQVDEITALRRQEKINARPIFVWEPQAKSCSRETFEHHKGVVAKVDIFSPNHAELASFFTQSSNIAVTFDKVTVEQQARAFLPSSSFRDICILVRCAEHGCFVLEVLQESPEQTRGRWMPSYHPPGSSAVVDPTGAGNAFLGGAALGYLKHADFVWAAAFGTVAASFAVEQVGLPSVERSDAKNRLAEYVACHVHA